MMDYESFKASLKVNPVRVQLSNDSQSKAGLDNEALFQLPFISMVVLLFAKSRVKPPIPQIGALVGECLEKSMPAFRTSQQHIGWSAQLRVRTVKALSFLEVSGLIVTNNRKGRIYATSLGKKVIAKALEPGTDLAYNLSVISRQYRNINVENRLEQKLDEI